MKTLREWSPLFLLRQEKPCPINDFVAVTSILPAPLASLPMTGSYRIFALLTLLSWITPGLASAAFADPGIHYEKDIRPILKAHCFQCHGEAGKREGGLDLRLRRLIVAGGESGPAIIPGKVSESHLVDRIRSGEMPPEEGSLDEEEMDLIARWVAGGALTARPEPETLGEEPYFTEEDYGWWSFQPIVRPIVPGQRNSTVRTSVDAFLLSRLEQLDPGLGFSRLADRPTLIRRATINLLGLPPTPDEVASFQEDTSPLAWQKVIDRLLASPHYGERWGRHWLDVAGYADSEGYTDADPVRENAYRYRDYVIRSLNQDKPLDKFILEQLAGDELVGEQGAELTPEVVEKLTATGFLRMVPDGTGSNVNQGLARNQVIADTIQVVGTSLLGMSIHCAQCHDHRYDPISQLDYYRFRAIFEPALNWKNWKAPSARQVSLYTEENKATRDRIEVKAKEVDQQRQTKVDFYIARTLHQELLMVEDAVRQPLQAAFQTSAEQQTDEQKLLLEDYPNVGKISGGALYLYERRREIRAKDLEARRGEKERQAIEALVRAELESLPAGEQQAVRAALEIASDDRTAAEQELLARYPQLIITAKTLAEREPDTVMMLDAYTKAAEEIRKGRIVEELKELADRAGEIRATIPRERFIRALQEDSGTVPPTFLFARGDHEQPKQEVSAASLTILGPETRVLANNEAMPTSGRRLALARQLTSGKHPLVARVLANRIWMHHFGRGLVNSPADFGMLGERPTHPDLLDWLADELVRSGWSVKHVHRLILCSTAFQQSAHASSALQEVDPDNRYYGRMTIRRLDAESLRDSVLAVSGWLNEKLYGDPVPVMEDEVGQIVIGKENLDGERKPTTAINLEGEEYRRSIYIQVRRSRPLATLEFFDSAVVTPNCPKRNSSNVTPQSLMMMNSDFALEYSERFARRLQAEAAGSVKEQLRRGWQLALGRTPLAEELAAAEKFLAMQQQALQESSEEKETAVLQFQALASFCQVLISSSRFVYVE